MSWVISDNMIKFNQIIGSSFLSPAYGLGGARATILSFCLSVPPSARKKFWLSPPPLKLWRAGIQAGEKEWGWGEGIFARLLETSSDFFGRRRGLKLGGGWDRFINPA